MTPPEPRPTPKHNRPTSRPDWYVTGQQTDTGKDLCPSDLIVFVTGNKMALLVCLDVKSLNCTTSNLGPHDLESRYKKRNAKTEGSKDQRRSVKRGCPTGFSGIVSLLNVQRVPVGRPGTPHPVGNGMKHGSEPLFPSTVPGDPRYPGRPAFVPVGPRHVRTHRVTGVGLRVESGSGSETTPRKDCEGGVKE